MALEWIRSTFLYIRALKNPTHYGQSLKPKQMDWNYCPTDLSLSCVDLTIISGFSTNLDRHGIEAKLQGGLWTYFLSHQHSQKPFLFKVGPSLTSLIICASEQTLIFICFHRTVSEKPKLPVFYRSDPHGRRYQHQANRLKEIGSDVVVVPSQPHYWAIRHLNCVFLLHSEAGRLMARYCVAFDTIKMFSSVAGTENLSDLVSLQKIPSNDIYILDGNGGICSVVYVVGRGNTTSTFCSFQWFMQ